MTIANRKSQIANSRTLDPHWDAEPAFRAHMRARMESRLQPATPTDPPRCLYCHRPLTPQERATCQHCDTRWRAFNRAESRWARLDTIGLRLLYIAAAIGLGCILGQLCSGGCR